MVEGRLMLSFSAGTGNRYCDGLTRRELMRVGGIGFGGITLSSLLRAQQAFAGNRSSAIATNVGGQPSSPRARSVIILYLSGGPSQLDMWDMKPQAPAEIRGTFRPIDTNVPGISICEHMPRMARLADQYTIVRSMSHDEADHIKGGYLVWTGGRLTRPIVQASAMKREDRPHIGSILSTLLDSPPTMPPFVMLPEYVSPVGMPRPGQYGGFLGATHDPYLVDSDPNLADYSPGSLKPVRDVAQLRLDNRRALLAQFERQASYLEQTAAVRNLDPYFEKAFSLVSSPAAQLAFDVSAESDKTRDRYGRHIFGQSTLIARRLVEAGVRLVQVNFIRHDNAKGGQGYDSHSVPPSPPHLPWAKNELLPPTDNAFAALIEDLFERQMLDETLVLMMGEFGRSPRFNKDGGRDHWPGCYSLVMAGAGIPGGRVFGSSDKITSAPLSDPVSPEGLLASVYHLVGVDPATEIHDRQSRPYRLVDGEPVPGLL
ncbi:MAG: DUF1501 domain-containing protein [Planctomycetaceae bacterium]